MRLEGGRTLALAGTLTWVDGPIILEDAATRTTLEIAGTLEATGNKFLQSTFTIGSIPSLAHVLPGGTLRKNTGTGSTSIFALLDNDGTIEAATGTLAVMGSLMNYDPGLRTLTGGTYDVSATLRFAGADVVTNAAAVVLDGPAAAITDGPGADGFRRVATNAAGGELTVTNGKSHTTTVAFANHGTLAVGADSTFASTGSYTQAAGTTRLDTTTSTLTATGASVDVTGGTLTGVGSVGPALTASGGTVAPGLGVGTLNASGTYSQGAGGTLGVEIRGTTAGAFDRLEVAGAATLSGTLQVEAVGGFVPQAGDSFRILNAASRTGEFLSVVGTSPGGSLAYTVEYDATGAILVVTDISVSVANVTVTEGDSGIVSAVFDVTLATPRPGKVTVAYATANGTAAAPGDFAPAAGSVVFEPGQTAKTVAVQVNGDLLSEADETFFVNLSNAQGTAIAKGQGVGTILDDDELPVLSITDTTAVEGDSGTSDAVFPVSLAPASGREVSVRFTTANGTATSGSDFSGASGTLTFAPGETSKTVTVRVTGDLLAEGDETFFVDLTDPVAATISDPRGAGTIVDDDLVSLTIGDTAVTEGNAGTTTATFPVTLSGAGTEQVTVAYATGNDSATAPDDFLPAGGTLTFAPGETSKSIEVAVNGDTLPEPNEQFRVTLSNPDNAAVADGLGIGTIADDGDESGTPDFQLLVSPTSQVLPPGGSVQYTVSAIGLFGFAAPLVLEALELPAGVTATFSTNPLVIPGTSTLTLSSTGAATIGSHGFVIRATGGGLVRELRASSTLDFGLIRIAPGRSRAGSRTRRPALRSRGSRSSGRSLPRSRPTQTATTAPTGPASVT